MPVNNNNPYTIDEATRSRVKAEVLKARARGMKRIEICALAGLDLSAFAKLMAGKKPFGIIPAIRLCAALGLEYRLAIGGRKAK